MMATLLQMWQAVSAMLAANTSASALSAIHKSHLLERTLWVAQGGRKMQQIVNKIIESQKQLPSYACVCVCCV